MKGKILYKRDSKGNVRVWSAEVFGADCPEHDQAYGYKVTHGLLNGAMQEEITHCWAKNVGRANETHALKQAELEATALYRKKVERDGYKYDLNDEDALLAPMLALDYSKVPHRIPKNTDLYLSPKLDGVRCIWIQGKGLQSRKGKFYEVPHIEALLKDVPLKLDGELYLHGYPLNEIVSAVKKPNDLTAKLEFHVFDIVHDSLYFYGRASAYEKVVKEINSPFIKAVPQVVRLRHEIPDSHNLFVSQGFEGIMIRVPDFPYEHTRSASLFKYKDFKEAEFTITGVSTDKEGNGVLEFDGFKARCRGTDEYRRHQVENPDKYIGKMATIRFFTHTPYGVPQFPVCIAVRDYE